MNTKKYRELKITKNFKTYYDLSIYELMCILMETRFNIYMTEQQIHDHMDKTLTKSKLISILNFVDEFENLDF